LITDQAGRVGSEATFRRSRPTGRRGDRGFASCRMLCGLQKRGGLP